MSRKRLCFTTSSVVVNDDHELILCVYTHTMCIPINQNLHVDSLYASCLLCTNEPKCLSDCDKSKCLQTGQTQSAD